MHSLEKRVYRVKRPTMKFFCPLCRSERAFTSSPRPTRWNYLQMLITSLLLALILFPLMGWYSLYAFFFVWGSFELVIRLRFRKEIPCPYCGFDASWYKRDIKVARKLVSEFWQTRGKDLSPAESTPQN